MAEKRKLVAEMEKVFTKVEQGIHDFEAIMSKMQEANSDNQRDKHQDDLKKEIKKLQRQRDQIKGWQNSNEVKDKDKLVNYRRLIEQRMEQFKEIERENKTKSYSKQGLQTLEKLDPKEAAKQETIDWLQTCLENLTTKCDFTESAVEGLQTGNAAGKKKKTATMDKEKTKHLEDLMHKLERHNFHIRQLEVIMRLINNESLEPQQVEATIKDEMEDYIARSEEDEYVENEYMYEDLKLGDLTEITHQLGNVTNIGTLEEAENESVTTASGSPVPSPAPSQTMGKENKEPSDGASCESPKLRHASGEMMSELKGRSSGSLPPRSHPATPLKLTGHDFSGLSMDSSPPTSATPPPLPGIPYNSIAAGKSLPKIPTASHSSKYTPDSHFPSTVSGGGDMSGGEGLMGEIVSPPSFPATHTHFFPTPIGQNHGPPQVRRSPPQLSQPSQYQQQQQQQQQQQLIQQASQVQSIVNAERNDYQHSVGGSSGGLSTTQIDQAILHASINRRSSPIKAMAMSTMNGPSSAETNGSVLPLRSIAEQAITINSAQMHLLNNSGNIPAEQLLQHANHDSTVNLAGGMYNYLRPTNPSSGTPQEAKIPPILGASPLGKVQMIAEHQTQLQLLDAAINQKMPLPMDAERLRVYVVRNHCGTPTYYPPLPPLLSETLEYFNRLQPETLFFIFYYMEGTKAQYLAAKALKKQSWRFHKKYLMWFQRHEEPTCITDDFEQGTYVYFDFEKWSQRKKEKFTFEYQFLEDRDLI